jgi:hypothetical protein
MTLLGEVPQRGAGRQSCSHHVRLDEAHDLVGRLFLEGPDYQGGRSVDPGVQAAELGSRDVGDPLEVIDIGDVAWHTDRSNAARSTLLDEIGDVSLIARRDNDVGANGGKRQRGRPSHAACRPDDYHR